MNSPSRRVAMKRGVVVSLFLSAALFGVPAIAAAGCQDQECKWDYGNSCYYCSNLVTFQCTFLSCSSCIASACPAPEPDPPTDPVDPPGGGGDPVDPDSPKDPTVVDFQSCGWFNVPCNTPCILCGGR